MSENNSVECLGFRAWMSAVKKEDTAMGYGKVTRPFSEWRKQYEAYRLDQLKLRHPLRAVPLTTNCCTGCKAFSGGEVRHHKDCPHYQESFSEMYDNLERELETWKKTAADMGSVIMQTRSDLEKRLAEEQTISAACRDVNRRLCEEKEKLEAALKTKDELYRLALSEVESDLVITCPNCGVSWNISTYSYCGGCGNNAYPTQKGG